MLFLAHAPGDSSSWQVPSLFVGSPRSFAVALAGELRHVKVTAVRVVILASC